MCKKQHELTPRYLKRKKFKYLATQERKTASTVGHRYRFSLSFDVHALLFTYKNRHNIIIKQTVMRAMLLPIDRQLVPKTY